MIKFTKTNLLFLAIMFFGFFGLAKSSQAATPVILYTDIISGPNTGGEDNNGAYLSIFGKNFGSDIDDITVTVGGGTVARKMYLGTSLGRTDIQQLSIQLGSNATTGAIKVSVGGVDSNTDKTFTVRAGDFYFLSLSGSDSTGIVNDISHPFRTINTGIRNLSNFGAGDFIIIRGGTYDLRDGTHALVNGQWYAAVKNGASSNEITMMGRPGETVLAELGDGSSLWGSYSGVSWNVLSNIQAHLNQCDLSGTISAINIGKPSAACPMSGIGKDSDSRFVNIDISGGCGSSLDSHLTVGWSSNIKLLGIGLHDSLDGGEAHSHPFYLSAEQHDTEMGWCTIYNIERSRALVQVHMDGFPGCYGVKSITDIHIHDNIIHTVNGQALLLAGGAGDIYVYNNLIYNSPARTIVPAYDDVISLRGDGDAMDAYLYNNTVYVNPWDTAAGYLLGLGNGGNGYNPHTVTLHNNIFYITESQDNYFTSRNAGWSLSNVISDNNLWYGSSSGMPSFGGAHEVNSNPLFTNAGANDYTLQSGSPAKNAGTSSVSSVITNDILGLTRPQGSAYDIGAFEYASGQIPDVTPPAAPSGLSVN